MSTTPYHLVVPVINMPRRIISFFTLNLSHPEGCQFDSCRLEWSLFSIIIPDKIKSENTHNVCSSSLKMKLLSDVRHTTSRPVMYAVRVCETIT